MQGITTNETKDKTRQDNVRGTETMFLFHYAHEFG